MLLIRTGASAHFSFHPPSRTWCPARHYIRAALRTEIAQSYLSVLLSICERTCLDISVCGSRQKASTDLCAFGLLTCPMCELLMPLLQICRKHPSEWRRCRCRCGERAWFFFFRIIVQSLNASQLKCEEEQGAATWPCLPFLTDEVESSCLWSLWLRHWYSDPPSHTSDIPILLFELHPLTTTGLNPSCIICLSPTQPC